MALSDQDAVLKLADGTLVMPDSSLRKPNAPKMIMVPTNTEAQKIIHNANKRLADLPTLPGHMHTISVVLVYSLWGLVDEDIAVATGLTKQQIATIRAHEAYATLQRDMVASIVRSDQDDVRNLIAQHSRAALATVVELMDSDDDKVKLGASNSILDRAGHRPNDIVEHRHTMESALRIEVIKRDETQTVPTLTQNPITGVWEDGKSS